MAMPVAQHSCWSDLQFLSSYTAHKWLQADWEQIFQKDNLLQNKIIKMPICTGMGKSQ